jgi:hypothetical protein
MADKPQLIADHGKSEKYGNLRGASLLAAQREFRQRAKSGLWISDLFPELATMADDLCLLRSMHTDIPNHNQAQLQLHTGSLQFPRPSLGVWSLYGLGSESENLPGFVWINPDKGNRQVLSSGFLPAAYQGTGVIPPAQGGRSRRGAGSDGLANIRNPRLSTDLQRMQFDYIQGLNDEKLRRDIQHPGVDGVIESYELAFRMQSHLPQVLDHVATEILA